MGNRNDRMREIDLKIDRYLVAYPPYVKDYYYSLHLVPRSKDTYLKIICSMITYMKDNGNDIKLLRWVSIININRFLHSIETTTKNGEIVNTSIAYRKLAWSALNSFFGFLLATRQIDENPMVHIQRAKGNDNVVRVYLDKPDIKQVISNIRGDNSEWKFRNLAIVKILLQTGIRSTALLDMNVEDIEFELSNRFDGLNDHNIIGASIEVIDKNNIRDEYYLTKETAISLNDWLIDRKFKLLTYGDINEKAVFINSEYTRLSLHGLEGMITKYSPIINGKQITPHKYRATFGTLLYKETKDIHYVQRQMHHASPDTTQIYIANDRHENKNAAKIMGSFIN